MSEPSEQPPLFDFPEVPTPTPAMVTKAFAHLTNQHAMVIDLIDIAMRYFSGPPNIDDIVNWERISYQIMKENSVVVLFLVRAIADLLVQLDVDREAVLARMRQAAVARLDDAEQVLRQQGYPT